MRGTWFVSPSLKVRSSLCNIYCLSILTKHLSFRLIFIQTFIFKGHLSFEQFNFTVIIWILLFYICNLQFEHWTFEHWTFEHCYITFLIWTLLLCICNSNIEHLTIWTLLRYIFNLNINIWTFEICPFQFTD